MDNTDIDKTTPAQLKMNRVTNIPDYKLTSNDIDSPQHVKFKSKEVRNPLEPVYKMETKSRRHVLQMGEIDGNKPKPSKSVVTRRATNSKDDIEGSKPKIRGVAPLHVI